MIVPMKKLWLLALECEREQTLEKLRDLGVVEVVYGELTESSDRTGAVNELANLDRVIGALSSRRGKAENAAENFPSEGADFLQYALTAWAENESLERELEALRKEVAALEVWGEYDPAMIEDLRKHNIYVYLCEAPGEKFSALKDSLEDASLVLLSHDRGFCRFVVVSQQSLDDEPLPAVAPGSRPLSAVYRDVAQVNENLNYTAKKLDAVSARLDELKNIRRHRAAAVEMLQVRDGLAQYGEVVALQGFVPEPAVAGLSQAAQENHWALLLNDPEPGEAVPVLMEPPHWVKPILPLFQFLGIAPGYDEFDMSPGMLIFFSIFFSMIINDGGYALLMLAGAIVAAVLLRKNPKAVMPCRLALVLSGCAAAWGICTGSYFGIEKSPLEFFASGENQTSHLQLVCFVLALVHLSLGHCWRLVNAASVREIIGQLGWIPILLLDFMVVLGLLVFPGMALPGWSLWAGGIGLVMVLFGAVDWRDVGAICNFPFDLIGSFTDTLSYVRLFAVGMSGTYMAQSFNDMGMQLWEISPWLIPVAIVVIVFGHTLNAALAFMSVLVHGVRLNTLEFSNHAGIRWGGQAYKPLRKND